MVKLVAQIQHPQYIFMCWVLQKTPQILGKPYHSPFKGKGSHAQTHPGFFEDYSPSEGCVLWLPGCAMVTNLRSITLTEKASGSPSSCSQAAFFPSLLGHPQQQSRYCKCKQLPPAPTCNPASSMDQLHFSKCAPTPSFFLLLQFPYF